MCTTATPVASYATDPDGFYFIANTGVNVPSTPGNNLPYGIRYYVAVCDVPGVTPGYWPARYMSDKLGSKEFDEEDFYVSNPTHLGFSIQPIDQPEARPDDVHASRSPCSTRGTTSSPTTTPRSRCRSTAAPEASSPGRSSER